MERLRIGLLGAARIARAGIVDPVAAEPRAVLAAVAARDPDRAADFAREHDVAIVAADYPALVSHPGIDLVYVATPPAHHAEWAARAIAQGKHVLVEKPFGLDAREAERVLALARDRGVRVFEAMHSPHHPLFRKIEAIVSSGALGVIRRVVARFDVALPRTPGEFRWDAAQGGGALMDLGVYPLAFCRRLLGEAFEIESVTADLVEGVDADFSAKLRFDGGVIAEVSSSFTKPVVMELAVEGDRGTLLADRIVVPHRGNRLETRIKGEILIEEVPGPSSWTAQLNAICDTLLDGRPFPLPEDDFVHSMRAIDRIRAAGGW
ncbi:MAG: Gfo/Idh/MocA family protein [Sphingobium sp.]